MRVLFLSRLEGGTLTGSCAGWRDGNGKVTSLRRSTRWAPLDVLQVGGHRWPRLASDQFLMQPSTPPCEKRVSAGI